MSLDLETETLFWDLSPVEGEGVQSQTFSETQSIGFGIWALSQT